MTLDQYRALPKEAQDGIFMGFMAMDMPDRKDVQEFTEHVEKCDRCAAKLRDAFTAFLARAIVIPRSQVSNLIKASKAELN